ncbi:TIGR04452 family lipoprotein [Leptospira sarikeiensis]|uniref:TIGR04452 family lipoprotein n=1 Tax=Leptospira sarikeiensis TaxID=2484943 RepID=A0A4R9K2X8_9LEPT|nr:TIGR04452 family lipoprotein [Leptospira sarikeiensis]TGL59496.1 TIGR04452 family lipoprotein [Leptospira sarikeiensis]
MTKSTFYKTIFIFLVSLIVTNCAILDPIGLTYDRTKGSEASSRIQDAAITTDIINSSLFYGYTFISLGSLLGPTISGIESDKYYKKSEVDACVNDIKGMKGFLIGATFTILSSCKLEADGLIL